MVLQDANELLFDSLLEIWVVIVSFYPYFDVDESEEELESDPWG